MGTWGKVIPTHYRYHLPSPFRVLLGNVVLLALLAPKVLLVKLVAPVKLVCPVLR